MANSDVDFYSLFNLNESATQRDITRAWRAFALKHHPDKVKFNDTEAQDRFRQGQIGYELLSDPATKALYDNTRTARLQKKRQNEMFAGKRRQMMDDLEARERGFKRPKTEEEDNEEKLERELRRLAEDGKRRRKEREEALKEEIAHTESLGLRGASLPQLDKSDHVSELDRTVKIQWPKDGPGQSIDQDQIVKLFSNFGTVQSAHLLKPKMLRMGRKNKKQLASVCMIQYASIAGAHKAVGDFPKQEGEEWNIFDSVNWVANKEPGSISGYQSSGSDAGSLPSTPARNSARTSGAAFLDMTNRAATPAAPTNGDGQRNTPSFYSFSPSANGSPFGKSLDTSSPSLEEMTLIRLKNAEKRRLADEIQRQDNEAAAAEAKKC